MLALMNTPFSVGPAPYLADDPLRQAMAILGEVARELAAGS